MSIDTTEAKISELTDKLKKRTDIMANRNVTACKLFFTNSIRKYVMSYVNRWRAKIDREKRVMRLADSLERKLRIGIEYHTFQKLVSYHYHSLNE